MTECPSRFSVVMWLTSDLPPAQMQALAGHLEHCAACRAELESLRANVAAFEAKADEHRRLLMAGIEAGAAIDHLGVSHPPTRVRSLWMRAVPAVALAAATCAVLVAVWVGRVPVSSPRAVFKGGASLQVVARRGNEQHFIQDGERLTERDALRFVLTTARSGYVTVFSVDENGKITAFYPDTDPASEPAPLHLESAGRHEMPGSVVLDDWIGREYFVAVFAEQPFDRGPIHRGVKEHLARHPAGPPAAGVLGIVGDVVVVPVVKVPVW